MPCRAKTAKICFVLLLVCPLLSGCWDRLELEDRAVILGLAVDKIPPKEMSDESKVTHMKAERSLPAEDQVAVTAQIAVPGRIPLGPQTGGGGGGGSGQQKPVWVLQAKGHTIEDAMMNLQQQVADRLFFGHLRVIVVSEAVARTGVDNLNDYFRRNSEVRRTIWLMVGNGSAANYMRISPELERVPSLYLLSTMDNAVQMGKFPSDFLGIFWSAVSAKGRAAYLPYLEVKEGQNVEVAGLAYFKEDKLAGITEPMQIAYLMEMLGIKQAGYSALVKVPGEPDGYVMFRGTSRKTRIHAEIRNGRPYFIVKIHVEGNITEKSSSDFQINDERKLAAIQGVLEENVKNGIETLIKQTQDKQSDIFGFGEYVRARCWRYWNASIKTADAWNRTYPDVGFEIHPEVRIRRVGMKAE